MKKFLKALLMAFVLIPCALAFAGCGSGLDAKASIDTKGKYATATSDDAKNFITEEVKAEDFKKGYKTTAVINYGNLDATITTIITLNEDGTISGMASKMEMKSKLQDRSAEAYLKDGVMYIDAKVGDKDYQYKVTADDDIIDDFDFAEVDVTEALAQFLLMTADLDDDTTLEKATSGKYTKWKLTETESDDEDDLEKLVSTVYFVFENNAMVGLRTEISYITYAIEMSMASTVVPFAGTIDYPKNFDKFTDEVPELDLFDFFSFF